MARIAPITQLDSFTYRLQSRGATMTLRRLEDGSWEMLTDNASARAWRGFILPKHFANLEQVELAYKSWRGITALVAIDINNTTETA